MNYRSYFLLALSVQLVCLISVLEAHSNGILTEACSTMAPVHGDAQPSNDTCLYETVPSQTTIIQGGSLTITLRNVTTNSFKGYMTMAFDASKPDDVGPIGTFSLPTDGQIMSCPDGVNNAISHKDNNSQKRNVQANWTAPIDFVGSVIFKTTFVRGESIFWVKEPSDIVMVILDSSTDSTDADTSSTTSTTPTTPSSNTEKTTTTTPTSTTVESTTTTITSTTVESTTATPTSTTVESTTTALTSTTVESTTATPTSTTVESTTTTAPPTKSPTTTVPPCGSASSLSFSWITGSILFTLAFSRQP